jgi:hypothetical protein
MELSSWELRPVSSTRNWEDFEEEEEEEVVNATDYHWKGVTSLKCKVVFIGLSTAATKFLEAHFSNAEKVATVAATSSMKKDTTTEAASIYCASEYGVGVVFCNSDRIDSHSYFSLLHCLFSHLECDR